MFRILYFGAEQNYVSIFFTRLNLIVRTIRKDFSRILQMVTKAWKLVQTLIMMFWKFFLTDPSKKVTFLMTSALFQVGYLFHKNRSYYIPLERYFDAESEKGLSRGVIIFSKKDMSIWKFKLWRHRIWWNFDFF